MANLDTNLTSSQIYLSRDRIRTFITENAKSYLELEKVDLTKSSFVSFMVNIISTLTSNLLFYESSVFKEFFLTKAQLMESVLDLSTFIGYNARSSTYSITDILMTIPIEFDHYPIEFTIPKNFHFMTPDNINFVTYYETVVSLDGANSPTITVNNTDENKTYNLDKTIDSESDPNTFSFLLPVRQYFTTEQTFQIDNDVKTYQFTTIDVNVSGKISSIEVWITEPSNQSQEDKYDEFASLYLMTSTDKGFTAKKTETGVTIYFGNNLIGYQPPPGSSVRVLINETLGEAGNIIAGSVTGGDRIYVLDDITGLSKLLNYTATNTSPATGGKDEESIQEIRANSIANLAAMKRLVSEDDYKNLNSIIPNTLFQSSPYPILKRSDIKCNEIQLYCNMLFEGGIVPTKNLHIDNIEVYTEIIKKGTLLSDPADPSKQYILLFDLTIDAINCSAYYSYIINDIFLPLTLEKTWPSGSDYNGILIQNVEAIYDSTSNDAFIYLYYVVNNEDPYTSCTLTVTKNDQTYPMFNNTTEKRFEYKFSPYTTFPEGDVKVDFTLISNSVYIETRSTTIILRKDLKGIMQSNLQIISDGEGLTRYFIYDVPVVDNEYYQTIDAKNFELSVIQYLMSTMSLSGTRMVTDFINVKFTNTSGISTNMQFNPVTKSSVKEISRISVPDSSMLGDRYIVSGVESGVWNGHKGKIAQCIDSINQLWYFIEPTLNEFVFNDYDQIKYIFNGANWINPTYEIPVKINIELFKIRGYNISDAELVNLVKENLLSELSSSFGSNASLYRSKIISIVQNTNGVAYCSLIDPKSDIFFNFEIEEFTTDQLLRYSPEYIYFTADNITVKIME